MAYSYQTGALRRKEHTEKTRFEYGKILSAEEKRKKEAAEKAAQTAVQLKAGETVHDLLQKGYHRKTKSVMEQDYFKDTQIGADDDAINLFTKGKTSDIPGSDLLIPNTPQVNPSAYESLGRRITEANPQFVRGTFDIEGATTKPYTSYSDPFWQGSKMTHYSQASDMTDEVWHTKIGQKFSKTLTDAPTNISFSQTDPNVGVFSDTKLTGRNVKISPDMVSDATSLVEGELKLAKEMGTWGKVGKALGPIGSVLAIGGGIKTLADPDAETGDKVAGAASVVGGTMTLGGAAASAGLIGGVSTGGAVAGTAGGATLAGVGVSNFWNPVGWGIGIGAGLYGIGKGTGLF